MSFMQHELKHKYVSLSVTADILQFYHTYQLLLLRNNRMTMLRHLYNVDS